MVVEGRRLRQRERKFGSPLCLVNNENTDTGVLEARLLGSEPELGKIGERNTVFYVPSESLR